MGKGNVFLGYARGTVGSIVLARVKGQQIVRAKNSKPHNRNSRAQILHRSRLSTLYKFTKQLPPGFLEGAFEDQRPRENWQSCFVRHNTKRAIMQPKIWVEDQSKPAFGKFMMSMGPIARDIVSTSEQEYSTYIGAVGVCFPTVTAPVYVWQFSQVIIDNYGLQDGDILNFFIYDCGPSVSIRDPKYRSAYRSPEVLTSSIKLDLHDNRLLTNVLRWVSFFPYRTDDGRLLQWVGVRCGTLHAPAMAIIVSRVDGSKVSCNTSYLAWPGANQAFWDHFESDEWVSNVLRSWGVSKTALLKGGE